MITTEKKYLSPEEYLKIERDAVTKSEYYKGEMFAMSGSTVNHNIISGNIFAALHIQLNNSDFIVFTGDVKICVSENGLFTYPDVSVISSNIIYYDESKDVVMNPVVIFEVLSKSTQRYDRGGKFMLYKEIDSLEEYILVSQNEIKIEHYTRQNVSDWHKTEINNTEQEIFLKSISCSIKVSDVYFKINF